MTNAKEEFLTEVSDKEVLCCKIYLERYWDEENVEAYLKIGFNESDYLQFLELLNVLYDNGLGGCQLKGVIWYKDGTYSERNEYDGANWWEYKVLPKIPKELKSF